MTALCFLPFSGSILKMSPKTENQKTTLFVLSRCPGFRLFGIDKSEIAN